MSATKLFAPPFFYCQQQAFGFARGYLSKHNGQWFICCISSDFCTYPIQFSRGVWQKLQKSNNLSKPWDFRLYFRTIPGFPGLVFRAVSIAAYGEYPDEIIDQFIIRGNLYSWDKKNRTVTVAIQPRHQKKRQQVIPQGPQDKPPGFRVVLHGSLTGTTLLPFQFWELVCKRQAQTLQIVGATWKANPQWASLKGASLKAKEEQKKWEGILERDTSPSLSLLPT